MILPLPPKLLIPIEIVEALEHELQKLKDENEKLQFELDLALAEIRHLKN